MNENKQDQVLDHSYDGIQEFDNPLPGWWLATFYGAIVFAVLYVGYYHFGPGRGPHEILASELEAMRMQERATRQSSPGPTEESLLAVFQDSQRREQGKKVFVEKCASCHATDGGGGIGPNLTDRFWIHGEGKLTDVMTVVADGVLDKGMPPWKGMLKPEELGSVVAHVHALKGTRPASPKPAQGTEVKN